MNGLINKINSKMKQKKLNQAVSNTTSSSLIYDKNIDTEVMFSPTQEFTNDQFSPHFGFYNGVLQLLDDEQAQPSNSFIAQPTNAVFSDGDLGTPNNSIQRLSKRMTRIVRDLNETLTDPSALAYLLQYMESKNLVHLIKFLLDVESFRISSQITISDQTREVHRYSSVHAQLIKDDAGRIFAKYIGFDAMSSVGITDSIRQSIIDRICLEDGSLDPECFRPAQEFILKIVQNRYFLDYMGSVYHYKHQLDVLTSGKIVLFDILNSHGALSSFIEFLDRNGVRRLIDFWLTADVFKRNLMSRKDYDKKEAQNDAMVLYNRYFSLQASESLNLPDLIRINLELKICRNEGGPLPDCFDEPQRVVIAHMDLTYLDPFLRSSLFRNFIQELIDTIETTPELPNPYRSRQIGSTTGSDRSSELILKSVSNINGSGAVRATGNSLLNVAKNSRSERNWRPSSSTETLSSAKEAIPSDPDSLWKRRDKRTSLAQVDRLGRYRRIFNDKLITREPLLTTSQKLRANWDKVIHPIDPKETLVADQVAQLIIADIQQMVSTSTTIPEQ